jgi:hypothetical protein
LSTPAEEVMDLLQEYADEARALEKSLIRIAWYMRGSVDLDAAYRMTYRQRKMSMALIEENLDNTSKTGIMMH